jgi:hypothetical protein
MSVGNQASTGTISGALTAFSTNLRDTLLGVQNLSVFVNGQGNGLTALENIGFSNAANPDNPGGVSDAQWALNAIAYLNTVAAVFFGTATQAAEFDFNNALAPLWGGQ